MAVEREQAREPKMDPAGLYREEIFTDRKVGTIRSLHPVKTDGSSDPGRTSLFVGEAQILTAVGALPISFDIPANSLADAVEKYAAAAQEAVERTMKELQDMRRQAASSIVIPQGGGGGFPPGGIGGGGKIQLP